MHKRDVTVSGSARERGRQIGELLKSEITANYLNQKKFYKSRDNFDYETWEEMCQRYVPMMERWTPAVLEEVRGVAEGARMDFRRVLALTTAYEKSFGRDDVSEKCTSFCAAGAATKGGQAIAAQTNDENLLEWRHEVDVVIHHKDAGREVLTYTHPGVPAYMGMNNKGLAVLWTYIDNGATKDGVPTTAIIRQLLEFGDIDSAVGFLEEVPHDVPNQFGLADRAGSLACVECFPNKVYVTRKPDCFVHTNHNVYAPDEPECTVGKTTWNRYDVMKGQIEASWGNIDAETAKDFLRCHDRAPNCVCVHPCGERPWTKTLAAMVYELGRGVMHIAFGNPCEVPYREYTFDRYE